MASTKALRSSVRSFNPQEDMMRRYHSKNHRLQQHYEDCLRFAREKGSEFYINGKPRRGAGHRNAFWNGFEGLSNRTFEPGTFAYAAYRAGQDFAKEQQETA